MPFRWKTPTRRGRWLPTRKEAGDAAVRAGVASRDEFSGQPYLHVLSEIEEKI
ncbi:MAG: hypothetical protein QOH47_2432 [Sphingomonadales bacterium]|jgi:hypothetical protein|nr:hypothetical protein [Sphingomonadales bacterium]